MTGIETAPEEADADRTRRRRRLRIIVGVAMLAVVALVLTAIYAERKVNDENRRVQRAALSVNVKPQDILDAAYTPSDEIGDAFGVASDRVWITISGVDAACIAIRSEYITSTRSSAFTVGPDGTLTPTAHC